MPCDETPKGASAAFDVPQSWPKYATPAMVRAQTARMIAGPDWD